jgi:RND family efflux transporter MFP subunit
LFGCKKSTEGTSAQHASQSSPGEPLLLAPEDVLLVKNSALATGPAITGSIVPERRADLRAEISSMVLQVLKENGDPVKKGEVLLRLDETSIKDALRSAEEAERASLQTLEQAERQLQRLKTLRASGMTSTQSLEDAEIRRNNAQSDLVASRARVVQARQQLQHTVVRAPFAGIVSERKASKGDTAALGKELLKVIDPDSMRFEGRVSSDKVGQVQVGQAVSFRVNGYAGQNFSGVVKRIDPSANPVTRQVEVLVGFAEGKQPGVAGLYAEGVVAAQNRQGVTLPESVLVRAGEQAIVWLVRQERLHKVQLKLGERDPRRGEFEVLSGLKPDDVVLRNPQITFKDGEKVQMIAAAKAGTPAKMAQGGK